MLVDLPSQGAHGVLTDLVEFNNPVAYVQDRARDLVIDEESSTRETRRCPFCDV